MQLRVSTILVCVMVGMANVATAKNDYQTIMVKLKSTVTLAETESLTLSKLSASFSHFQPAQVTPLFKSKQFSPPSIALFSKFGLDRYLKIELPSSQPAEALLAELKNHPLFETAFFTCFYKIHDLPNDPLLPQQWLIDNINLPAAWNITYGDSAILIAIIDTGIDYFHQDLVANLWLNLKEDLNQNGKIDSSDFNGLDDDDNGYVDDLRGWDFTDAPHFPDSGDYLTPDNDPNDENGHGTAVAGIAAATANNSLGIAGVAPGCRLMNLRAGTSQGLLEEDDVASAIIYAVDNGARIINMSFGDVAVTPMLRDVIQFAFESGVTLIASAGNSASAEIHYPSGLAQVISVGATNADDGLASFSNFGSTIDVVAPGLKVLTTAPGNRYREFSGTSAAAPIVSGVAGLILSYIQSLTNQDVRNVLVSSATDLGNPGWDEDFGAGRVDPSLALKIRQVSQASIEKPFFDQGFYVDSILISGTASGALLASYELLYGMGINPTEWTSILLVDHRQLVNDILGVWPITHLKDTSYVLRLLVQDIDGHSVEDRTRILIDRTAPQLLSIKQLNLLDGYRHCQLLSFETDDVTRAEIFYRHQNSSEAFTKRVLEYEVQKHRFNFCEPGKWEFYLRLNNKSELTTIVDNFGAYYKINLTDPDVDIHRFVQLEYDLPPLYLLNKPVDFNGDGALEFVGNEIVDQQVFGKMAVFEFKNRQFSQTKISSAVLIPRDIGDSDQDGKWEILAGAGPQSFILESEIAGEFPQKIVWADSTDFWASRFADLDADGRWEIIGRRDKTFLIFENSNENNYAFVSLLENLSTGSNGTGVPHTESGDFDNDGFQEILIADEDGDIYLYEAAADNVYQFIWQDRLPLVDAINFISSGDYDGDGVAEFAAGCHSSSELDLEHEYDGRYWTFRIYDAIGNDQYIPVWEQSFFGFANPAEYASGLSSGDVDNNGDDELLLNVFPDFYLIDYDTITKKYQPSGYFSPSRSHTNLIADIDGDSKTEFLVCAGARTIVLQDRQVASFAGPLTPAGFDAYPQNERQVCLSWLPVEKISYYQIYRGDKTENLFNIGSTTLTSFIDSAVTANQVYYYAVTSFDLQTTPNESRRTAAISAKPGQQPFCQSIYFLPPNQVRLQFSEVMDKSITNISAYLFSEKLGQPLSAVSARSGEEVLLTLDNNKITEGTYQVNVSQVRDKDRTPIDTTRNRLTFEVTQQIDSFYLISAAMENGNTIILNFSLPLDSLSATQKSNYSFEPYLEIEKLIFSIYSPTQLRLVIGENQLFHSRYVVTAQNIVSQSGINIEKGQGSQTLLIVSGGDNTFKIFAYPNPCRASSGQETIRFANVSKSHTVTILTVSGETIRTLVPSSIDKDLVWDLKNEKGVAVGSGVYVFSAKNGEEQQTGKLAIVR